MGKELVIQTNSNSADIALLRDGKLMEIHHEHYGGEYLVGDVYMGKVKKLLPHLNACFVDIGYEKDAFLHYHDLGPNIPSFNAFIDGIKHKRVHTHLLSGFKFLPEIIKTGLIEEVFKTGDNVLVQIVKEPISTKGPRLTSQISIPGRYFILLPFGETVSVSKKIADREERDRLKNILTSIKPKGFGLIVRTVSEGKSVEEMDKDLRDLIEKWKEIYTNLKSNKKRLYTEPQKAELLLRDILNDSFEEIKVDNQLFYNKLETVLQNIAPEKTKLLKLVKPIKHKTLFGEAGINRQMQTLFGKIVNIGGGAYLVIEHTEAMHVIDVNSGSKRVKDDTQEENAIKTNLEAADEIARQLMLRDMGGIVVIDFIDMRITNNRKILLEKMRAAMGEDRAKHTILPISKFGLMQITRQRVRPELQIEQSAECQLCKGSGTAAPAIFIAEVIQTKLADYVTENKLHGFIIHLRVHPFLKAYLLHGWPSIRFRWLLKYKKWVVITESQDVALPEYEFLDTIELEK